jgi:uncharacterized protein
MIRIRRELQSSLIKDAKKSPVIAILGPRQSGKTTLAITTFPEHNYVSLEDYDVRAFATSDPRGFLAQYATSPGVILDEVQHVPTILSYIQTSVDRARKPGYYIVTGSQNFLVTQAVTQTLAGRVSFHTLLPLSIAELRDANISLPGADRAILNGFYPIIYAQNYNPVEWYADYIMAYVERDVRTITQVTDLVVFQRFIKMCAGRIGQLVNLTSLGNDCGVSYNTIKKWLGVLEASYIIFPLQPHFQNFNKRLMQTPKIYFYDTGLACSLLGIETEEQLALHYLKGGLFESMIISDLYKSFYNSDRSPRLYFWRDKTGHEVDCILERADKLFPIEIKAGMTINNDFFDGLAYWNELAHAKPENSFVVYGGTEIQKRSKGNVIGWPHISSIFEKTER